MSVVQADTAIRSEQLNTIQVLSPPNEADSKFKTTATELCGCCCLTLKALRTPQAGFGWRQP
ncbi:hypothetical Protein YC6258_01926 [Gynuella sunshinyii YC6258]|uniref:Uncharacterized protein n=1 Tax=Gynuella sunshinyii YC6258 TaxID=1445510 RepID=A0A0C5V358_9GAMM|nr:hypothetical Protein YC6258_01926 [Gynuella sunshinyii YC6258]